MPEMSRRCPLATLKMLAPCSASSAGKDRPSGAAKFVCGWVLMPSGGDRAHIARGQIVEGHARPVSRLVADEENLLASR